MALPPDPPGTPEPPSDPATSTIARRPESVRRTAHINMVWPDGRQGPMELRGRARDLRTAGDGTATVLGQASMIIDVGDNRTITAATLEPHHDGAALLVGAQGGGGYRRQLDEVLPGEREAGTPLYYLLDDVAGATLIAGFAWSRHVDDWMNRDAVQHKQRPDLCSRPVSARGSAPEPFRSHGSSTTGTCIITSHRRWKLPTLMTR